MFAVVVILSLCTLNISLCAYGQQPAQIRRIGMLLSGSATRPSGMFDIFRGALRNLGYIEGSNLAVDVLWSEGRPERLPILAADLVALTPEVIVTFTTDGALAAKKATATIPIVFMQVADPVGSGLIASLAHPDGNITGLTDYGLDLVAKHVELIHAVAPKTSRIGVLMSDSPIHPPQVKRIEEAARSIGVSVLPTMDKSVRDLENAFAALERGNARALIVLGGSTQTSQRDEIAALALKGRMPTVFPSRAYVERGGLMSYGPNLSETLKLGATYVDRILKGARPGDLPVEQPPKFELIINLRTAKALGLTIPQSLLLRADEVIE